MTADESDGEPEFPFVGNHPALDFLNTRPREEDEPVELLEGFRDLLEWLGRAGLLGEERLRTAERRWAGTEAGGKVLGEARTLRAAIRDAVQAVRGGEAVPEEALEVVNRTLAAGGVRPKLSASEDGYQIQRDLELEEPVQLLRPLAEAAAELLSEVDPELIKECDGPGCVLLFHDTTRNHSRRWCSMQTCGNRAKVARYRERTAD